MIATAVRVNATLILCALGATAAHAQQGFSIQQVMSSPFPAGMVASSQHDLLAWVQNAEGVRNIWVSSGPGHDGRQLTTYTEDDGQEITNLEFTPDGQALVFVRGGAPNGRGEIPNPTSAPEWAKREIWTVTVAGGDPRQLTEGTAPAVSPGGDRVTFLKSGQVWSVALSGEADAEQMFTVRGVAGSLRWSPVGDRLAFVSTRGDHSFVGIYDPAQEEVAYVSPSVDRDRNPVWSPDGTRIAFTRQPNERQRLPFMPRRSAHPWSILVADATTRQARTLWTARQGVGSAFHGIAGSDQILWGSGDRLVFPWEREGWTLLYSIATSGGDPALLTPGEFEVEHVTLTADRRAVIYSSNQAHIDRRGIWRVPVSGGRATPITETAELAWAPVVTGRETIGFMRSDTRSPAAAFVRTPADDPHPLAAQSLPPDFPTNLLVEPEQVIFSAADGMPIHGQLFKPADLGAGERRPAVLFFHGGSRRQMLLGWHYLGYYHSAYALNQYLASQGFVVLSVNYRSGIGYGLDFREALDYGARGASEFNDVLGAGLYLRGRPDVDPDRIGLWGGSYGGYLTALGLARASDLFAAGVDIHGVHDWNIVIRNFVPSYNAAGREEVARLAFESSPMAYIESWQSPVLLIHGDDDRNVPFSETVNLVESLRGQGVEFEQLIFPDEVHGFLLHRNWLAAYEATADFFQRKLGLGSANATDNSSEQQ